MAKRKKRKKRWIGKMFARARRKGTIGRCTGKKFGGPSCRPGTKAYNAAKTIRRLARRKKRRRR